MNTLEQPPKKDPSTTVEEYFKQEDATKKLAEQAALAAKLEAPVALKEIKDPKMFAAIEFFQALPDTEGKWGEVFESLQKDELTPQAYDFLKKFVNGEAGPKATYFFDEKKNEGFFETPQMKEFREAKDEFQGKFGAKLDTWKSKGFVVEDMNSLVKAYMADKGLDLVTTADKKVGWGTPGSGFDFKM
jgi:hypothetical protein